MTSIDQDLYDALHGALTRLREKRPEVAARPRGVREPERLRVLRSWGLPVALERVLVEEWPTAPLLIDELRWKSVPDNTVYTDLSCPQFGMFGIGYGPCTDVITVDIRDPRLPVYLLYMPAMVDSDRSSDEPFCVRIAESLPSFLETLVLEGGDPWHYWDYHSAIEACGSEFPPPEARPRLRDSFGAEDGDLDHPIPWELMVQP